MFIPIITPILELRIRNNKIYGLANIYLLILFIYFLIKCTYVIFLFNNIFIFLLSILFFPITFVLAMGLINYSEEKDLYISKVKEKIRILKEKSN